jgi:hypothetical protein
MKGQYEQLCNAAALALLKIPQSSGIGSSMEKKFRYWLISEEKTKIKFPPNEENVIIEALKHAL